MNYWGGSSLNDSGEVPVLRSMAKSITPEGVVFDVGANAGQYAQMARSILHDKGVIYAFEPSGPTYKTLVRNTSALEKIHCANVGFGAVESEMTLYYASAGSTIASLYPLQPNEKDAKSQLSENIQITTIDSFCEKEGIANIHLLKIDVEGHELAVLQGAQRMLKEKRIANIQFEFGEFHVESRTFIKDFYELLGSEASFYRIVRDGVRYMGAYEPKLEVFNTTNYLVSFDPPTIQ